MTLEHISWAMKQDIKGAEYKVLLQLANRCNGRGIYSQGQEILVATTGYKERAIREAIKSLRDLDLLHTERQRSEFGIGRSADLIILHPSNNRYTLPDYIESPEEIEYLRRSRAENETFGEWGICPSQPLPAENAGKAKEPVDNFAPKNVLPSQPLPAENAGKPNLTGTTVPVENAILPVEQKSALIGTARATRALKGNLLTDNQSISQSVTSSTGAREKMTDGLTEANQALKTYPSQPIGTMPAEVAQLQLRTAINRTTPGLLDAVDTATLDAIMRLLVSREERRGKQVQNPVGFCIRAIANEPGGIEALTALATIERYTAQETQPAYAPAPLPSAPVAFCQMHTREYTGTCPLCLKESTGALTIVSPEIPADPEAGKAFRDQIRARREQKAA
ncbi:hypothetical protein [Rothia sp. ZJ932]|uniref:hypothetical protein n=1 Tax=Rothia sp. ZJ932 TaxID=2810516 RepID=UPI0019680F38|nr:hypothetical protein [Rothia sp. ZJ932]QRZ61781.1 hypothetical protein JR346_01165 [Rothia sp. ZJ932]